MISSFLSSLALGPSCSDSPCSSSGAALELLSMREAQAKFRLSALSFNDYFLLVTEYESAFHNYMPVVILSIALLE